MRDPTWEGENHTRIAAPFEQTPGALLHFPVTSFTLETSLNYWLSSTLDGETSVLQCRRALCPLMKALERVSWTKRLSRLRLQELQLPPSTCHGFCSHSWQCPTGWWRAAQFSLPQCCSAHCATWGRTRDPASGRKPCPPHAVLAPATSDTIQSGLNLPD